jgi:hypothetical protein
MNSDNLLPLFVGLILGYIAGILYSLFIVKPTVDKQNCKEYWDAEMGVIEPPDPPHFDTRMSNEEWADAMIEEILRKAGSHE